MLGLVVGAGDLRAISRSAGVAPIHETGFFSTNDVGNRFLNFVLSKLRPIVPGIIVNTMLAHDS